MKRNLFHGQDVFKSYCFSCKILSHKMQPHVLWWRANYVVKTIFQWPNLPYWIKNFSTCDKLRVKGHLEITNSWKEMEQKMMIRMMEKMSFLSMSYLGQGLQLG
jgi:hypothetical protein